MSIDTARAAHAMDKVRQFLLENYLFTTDAQALANDDSLLQKGIIDSTGMMELIQFLESEFNLAITDSELVPENLDSVNAIVSFILLKSDGSHLAATGGR